MSHRITPAGLSAALPDFAIGIVCLIVWVRPDWLLEGALEYVVMVMLLEFIVIHSSVFLGTTMVSNAEPRLKTKSVLGLGAFYTLFVAGISAAFKSWWPLASFWGQMGNRLLGVWFDRAPSEEQKQKVQLGWGVTCVCYLLGCFATVLLPIPRLGITPEVVARANLSGEGLWIDQPWRVAAFGFLYFTLVGWSELYEHGWAAKRARAAKDGTARAA
jgi:hypothetical protein